MRPFSSCTHSMEGDRKGLNGHALVFFAVFAKESPISQAYTKKKVEEVNASGVKRDQKDTGKVKAMASMTMSWQV